MNNKIKKIVLLFLLIVSLQSCKNFNDKSRTKPFIVISKSDYNQLNEKIFCKYIYQDSNNKIFSFYDVDTLYHIGDTIK